MLPHLPPQLPALSFQGTQDSALLIARRSLDQAQIAVVVLMPRTPEDNSGTDAFDKYAKDCSEAQTLFNHFAYKALTSKHKHLRIKTDKSE
jgi:hypothetical protein